jgi:hypothetical protein
MTNLTARQRHTCCLSCGLAELDDYQRDTDIGWVFYHEQDWEIAKRSGQIYLAYGAYEWSKVPPEKIAETIMNILKTHNLQAKWNGDPNERILVNLR